MKKSSHLILVLLLLALSPSLQAAVEKDLGLGLDYLRITDAKADLPAMLDAIEHHPALVLDLRSVSAGANFAQALHTALAKPPAPHAVRIVLINATTEPALITALDYDGLFSVITIGPRSPALTPDIAVATSDAEDRRALAALEVGTPVEKLITDNHDKRRYDEARLVQDHASGVNPPDSALPSDADDDSVSTEPPVDKKAAEPDKKTEPAPVIDLVLERAVQLHRALLALKKL